MGERAYGKSKLGLQKLGLCNKCFFYSVLPKENCPVSMNGTVWAHVWAPWLCIL